MSLSIDIYVNIYIYTYYKRTSLSSYSRSLHLQDMRSTVNLKPALKYSGPRVYGSS